MKTILLSLLLFFSPILGVPSDGCGGNMGGSPQPGHHDKYSVDVNDPDQGQVTRDYVLHVPANYDHSNNVPVPLVLDYHGWTGSADNQIQNVPWTSVADADSSGGWPCHNHGQGSCQMCISSCRLSICEHGWYE